MCVVGYLLINMSVRVRTHKRTRRVDFVYTDSVVADSRSCSVAWITRYRLRVSAPPLDRRPGNRERPLRAPNVSLRRQRLCENSFRAAPLSRKSDIDFLCAADLYPLMSRLGFKWTVHASRRC